MPESEQVPLPSEPHSRKPLTGLVEVFRLGDEGNIVVKFLHRCSTHVPAAPPTTMLWRWIAAIGPVAAATDQLKPVANNLCGVAILPVLIGPFSGADTPFDIGLAPLAKIFPSDFRRPRIECNAVPLCALLAVAVPVLVGLRRGDGHIGDRRPVGHVPHLRVSPQMAQQDHFIHACHGFLLDMKR